MTAHQGFFEGGLVEFLGLAEKVFKESRVRSLADEVWAAILARPFTSAAVFSIPFSLTRWYARALKGKASPFFTLMVAALLAVCVVGLEVRSDPVKLVERSRLHRLLSQFKAFK